MDKIKALLKQAISNIEEVGITADNIDELKCLVGIKKDIAKCENLDKTTEVMTMRYRSDYDNYGRRSMDGRFMRGNSAGRYGHRLSEDYMQRLMDGYDDYKYCLDDYNRSGNYGAKDKGMEALEYLLDGFVGFFENLQDTSSSPEEMELIKKYARKIKDM